MFGGLLFVYQFKVLSIMYVIFVNNYTRFSWLFPMKKKSKFFAIFSSFKKMVENQFDVKIKSFQSDGDGKFISKISTSLLEEKWN